MNNEKTYSPSPAELAVVDLLQRHGAPKDVSFVAMEAEFPGMAGWTTYVMRFRKDGKLYEGESWRVVAWPRISFVEMQALGMIEPPPGF